MGLNMIDGRFRCLFDETAEQPATAAFRPPLAAVPRAPLPVADYFIIADGVPGDIECR